MPKTINEDDLFDAVLHVVGEHGYQSATTRRIAAAAGVNEVTLFRRYGDKRSLLLAAIHREIGRLQSDEITPTDDVESDLRRVLAYYQRLYRERGAVVTTLLLESLRDPELAAIISEPLALMTRIRTIIEHHQRRGVLAAEPAERSVIALVGPLLMAAALGHSDNAPMTDVEALTSRFLDGHRA